MAYYTTSNAATYRYWVTTDTTASTSATTTGIDYTWDNWNYSTTDTVTYTDNTVWKYWTSDGTGDSFYLVKPEKTIVIPEVRIAEEKTVEQQRAEKVQQVINRSWRDYLIEEDRKRKEQVELTAQDLLADLIDEEAFRIYKETKRLVVHGRNHDYVIQKGRGVYRVEKGRVIDLCIHLQNRFKYPATDNVIGLKLMIDASEYQFNRTADDHGEVLGEESRKDIFKLVEDSKNRRAIG